MTFLLLLTAPAPVFCGFHQSYSEAQPPRSRVNRRI